MSASGCPFCMGGLNRSLSKPSWSRDRLPKAPTVPMKTTPRNNQARHQSRVAAGKKSRTAKMATLKMMLATDLRMDMCSLPSPAEGLHRTAPLLFGRQAMHDLQRAERYRATASAASGGKKRSGWLMGSTGRRRWFQSVIPGRTPDPRSDVNDGNPALQLVVTAAVKEIRDSNRGCHACHLETSKKRLVIHDVVCQKPFVNSAVAKVPGRYVAESTPGSHPRKKQDVVLIPEWMASLHCLGRDRRLPGAPARLGGCGILLGFRDGGQ